MRVTSLTIRKFLWLLTALISAFLFYHYRTVGEFYHSIYPEMAHALYFCETWMNITLYAAIISLIMMLREK